MFKTPPTRSQDKFATPARQLITVTEPSPISSEIDTAEYDHGEHHHQTKQYLPTPRTPLAQQDANATSPKKRALSINTSHGFQYFKTKQHYTSPYISSPLSSPVSIFSNNDQSPIISSSPKDEDHTKYLPHLTSLSDAEVSKELEDFIIDPNFKFSVSSDRIIGKGSFSAVLKSQFNDKDYAIKIPSKTKNSRPIYREALNYKFISSFLQLHEFSLDEFPILNAYGLTYLTRADYHRIRYGETLPCLVLSCLSCNLEQLIKETPKSNEQNNLHIGNDLWWKLAKQLTMGLIVFKDCEMLHNDLKTANILYDSVNQDFKIADLTSSGLIEDITKEFQDKLNLGISMDFTLQYAAPEILNNHSIPPTYQTDLYSIGLILLSAAIGEEPYSEVLSNNRSNFIYLTECIKKNKVLDLLSDKSWQILSSNPQALKLIQLILIERVDLQQIVSILSSD